MDPRSTRISDLWLTAVRLRSRTTLYRMGVGIAACLIFAPLMGWQICLAWMIGYLLVQEIERQLFRRLIKPGAGDLPPLKAMLAHVIVGLNACMFGMIALPAWAIGGPMGGVAASLLLSAGMMNSLVLSAGSLRMFICTVVPQWIIMGFTPLFMARYGASADVILAASVAIAAYGVFCLTTRQHLFQARRAALRAQIEADRKHEAAVRAERERSAMLTTVAHDLRTPISAILTGAAKVEESDIPSVRRQHVALIRDAGTMMRDLLDDLLDHARLQAGRMSIEAQSFDVRQLLSQTVRLWQAPVRAKGLKLRLEGACTVPRYLCGDPMRLRQVLNNLISNALKFTARGAITIRLRSWLDEHGDHVLLIDVEDTGYGMTPQQMARLFTPFDQTAEGVAARFGGSGLGLAISRHLAELMGGRLTVRSQPAKGSTFTLSLTLQEGRAPIRDGIVPTPAVPEAVTASPQEPDPACALRILVVDDHAINRRAIQVILGALDCQITMAENGREALDLCLHQPFDVIFMDVRMPELDGRETTRRLRAGGGMNADVPVIAVTADNAREDIEACKAAGMSQFISKPLTPHALLDALQQTLTDAESMATARPEAVTAA